MHHYITQIKRQRSRLLGVTLGNYESKIPIHILSTYAPRSGHTEAERRHQWGEVNEILNRTCKRRMIIWRADANGQLGRDKEEGKTERPNENTTRSKIGPYARAKTEKETERNWQKCAKHNR